MVACVSFRKGLLGGSNKGCRLVVHGGWGLKF